MEELTRVLENKSNAHEVNVRIKQMDSKIEEIYSEITKKLQSCALQKDLNSISSAIEKKADLEEVNESL